MLNGVLNVDIYLNLIYFTHTLHCRLLCQSHINPCLVIIQCTTSRTHVEYSCWWTFAVVLLLPYPNATAARRSAMETVKVQKELCLLLSAKAQLLLAWRLLLIVSLAVADMADTTAMPTKDRALKGREEKMVVAGKWNHVSRKTTSCHRRCLFTSPPGTAKSDDDAHVFWRLSYDVSMLIYGSSPLWFNYRHMGLTTNEGWSWA